MAAKKKSYRILLSRVQTAGNCEEVCTTSSEESLVACGHPVHLYCVLPVTSFCLDVD